MENQQPQFAFGVLRILDSAFYIEEAFDPKPEEVKIGYALGFFNNIEENWVQFNIRADFTIETSKLFASNTVVTKFGITDIKPFVNSDNNTINWPTNALETMFGIAFSHLRAIMAKNIGASKYKDYIVPLINPSSLFKQLTESHPDFKVVTKKEEPKKMEDIVLAPTANAKKTKKAAK